jgi:hypothetical protein
VAGSGGTGLVSSITGTPIQYAGGGGGGINSGTAGLSAAGGGNGASGPANGSNATANTGGGGGGAADTTNAVLYTGGNGGSGVVIIRYPANCAPPASTTNLQQVLYNNNYQIYVFTSSGTITF